MKKTIILIMILFFAVLSCQKKECNCEINPQIVIENDSIINEVLSRKFMDYDGKPFVVDSSKNHFEAYWNKYNEPILHTRNDESYRLSIVVLLYDYFKLYRTESKKEKYSLYIKEFAVGTTVGTMGRKDSLVTSIEKELTIAEWSKIQNAFEKNCFWNMPTDIKEDDGYLDGSGWLLEGMNKNNSCIDRNMHFVGRNSPPDSSAFMNICEVFMEIDSLDIKDFFSDYQKNIE